MLASRWTLLAAAALVTGGFLAAPPAQAQPVSTAISSNFNGTAIPAGRTIWFNSHLKYSGPTTSPVTLRFENAQVVFEANGVPYTLAVPDGIIVLSPAATSASTVFDGTDWVTTVPSSEGGDIFLQGLGFPVPVDFPGGISPVVWSAEFSSDTPSVCVNWQWSAAVYTSFSTDNNALLVAPTDEGVQAGSPVAYTDFVVGGARGGGGSNLTGSNSGTGSACIDQPVAVETASWSAIKSLYRD